MPNSIQERFKFEPSKNVLGLWLSTRKQKRVGHGYVVHGFFSTHSFIWDTIFFIIGLVIELLIFGFFMTLVEVDVVSNWIALPLIIILDLVFILLVHQNKAPNVKFENALPYIGDEDNPLTHSKVINEEQLSTHFEISKKNIISYLGVFLEVISCVIKIFYLNAAYGLGVDPISIGIVVGYITQTFCYINSGGYFLLGIFTNLFLAFEYKKFKNSQGKNDDFNAKITDLPFESSIKLKPTIEDNRNKSVFFLELDKNHTENILAYKISCLGVPLDSDIIEFAAMQDTKEARKEVMNFGHKLQLIKFSVKA